MMRNEHGEKTVSHIQTAKRYRIGRLIAEDYARAITMPLQARWTGGMENVYRVRVEPDTKTVEVICLGIDSIDADTEGIYDDTSKLPEWMQERLAVLSMMKVDPPQNKVEGVGMRIDEHVYWIIKG
jgi:hypothetical protein